MSRALESRESGTRRKSVSTGAYNPKRPISCNYHLGLALEPYVFSCYRQPTDASY